MGKRVVSVFQGEEGVGRLWWVLESTLSLSLSLSGVEEERLTTELRNKLTKACEKESLFFS